MTLIIDCPSCRRKLRVPDELLGTTVKCPSCAVTFTASDSLSAAPPAPEGHAAGITAADPEAGASEPLAPGVPLETSPPRPEAARPAPKNCHACGEPVRAGASRCQACGEPLDLDAEPDDRPPWERSGRGGIRRDTEPDRGTIVLTLGILSIYPGIMIAPLGLCLGLAAWVMGQGDLNKIKNNLMDPRGKDMTQWGWVLGIIGTIMNGLLTLCCLGMIGLMVAADSRPAPRKATPPPAAPKFQAPSMLIPWRCAQ